jgi:calcineurin-like phosphoesterase family protein
MTVWFTSDHHFDHTNIIKHCARPYKDAHEMNDKLIGLWNSVVKPTDTVYHLGDFAWRASPQRIGLIASKLNGSIKLLLGNHDKETVLRQVKNIEILGHYHRLVVDGQAIVMCHYPFKSWHGSFRGTWNVHGHCHGKLKPCHNQFDVSVDHCSFKPISLEDLKSRIDTINNICTVFREETREDQINDD